jgi:GDPmannose 4,6-dehydratase
MSFKKTSAITGVTGQDGSYLAELLLEKGYRVFGLYRRTSMEDRHRFELLKNCLGHPNFKLIEADVTDFFSIQNLFRLHTVDEFYNLAAQSHVGTSFVSPETTHQINSTGVLNCLEAIRGLSPKTKFYQASTSELYGDNTQAPQSESTNFQPVSPYACSKLCAHNFVINYRKAYGLHASCGILFNHESPRRGERFVTRKVTKAVARIKLGLQDKLELGNLHSMRDWGYAKEYVEGMWMMLQQEQPDDYVLATGETHTIKELVEYAFSLAGITDWQRYVTIVKEEMRPSEVPLLCGDASKAKQKLGWEPKTKFKELIKLMYEEDLAKEIANS